MKNNKYLLIVSGSFLDIEQTIDKIKENMDLMPIENLSFILAGQEYLDDYLDNLPFDSQLNDIIKNSPGHSVYFGMFKTRNSEEDLDFYIGTNKLSEKVDFFTLDLDEFKSLYFENKEVDLI